MQTFVKSLLVSPFIFISFVFAADPCNPGGPLPIRVFPESYGDSPAKISSDQHFTVELNCPIDEASLAKGAWFEVEGIANKVPVRVVTGPEREEALCKLNTSGMENLLVIAAKQNFPERTPVTLVWGAGIRSKSGHVRSEEQTFEYISRAPFSVTTRCQHSYADGSCDPFLPVYAVFSEQIAETTKNGHYQSSYDIRLKTKDGRTLWGEKSAFLENDESLPAYLFKAPFLSKSELYLEFPPTLEDKFGRTLPADLKTPLVVRTGAIPPMVRFGAVFGVLELNGANALPLTLRNVESELSIRAGSSDPTAAPGNLKAMISKVSDAAAAVSWIAKTQKRYEDIEKNTQSIFTENANTAVDTFEVTKPNGEEAFEVVGIPIQKPGFYVLEVESQQMGEMLRGTGQKLYVPTTALVTDLAVSIKLGATSSLVWVTSLSTGLPVPGAQVVVQDCAAKELWRGVTDNRGVAAAAFGKSNSIPRCDWTPQYISAPGVKSMQYDSASVLVSATKGDDFSFALSGWDEGIESWRFGMPTSWGQPEHRVIQTVFDRMLFKRGETVSMKHVIRQKDAGGFHVPEDRPSALRISHFGSGDNFDLQTTWDEQGTADATWKIPENAKLGDYSVGFLDGGSSYPRFSSGSFSVLDYRLPLSTASIAVPADQKLIPPSLTVDLAVRYLAGGGAGALPVKLRYQLQPQEFAPGGELKDYLFGREEPISTARQDFEYEEEQSEEQSAARPFLAILKSIDGKLDQNGTTRLALSDLPQISRPARLSMELEYRDPNGEVQTVSNSVPMLPGPTIVGIKADGWHATRDNFAFTVAVANARGKGVGDVPVEVNLYQREVYSHRKRLVGGTFAYENIAEDNRQGIVCKGKSNDSGILKCAGKIQIAGNYILEATAFDPSGATSTSAVSIWVHEGDGIWFPQSNSDRMDLIAEKDSYEPGETARFQVRMPFKEASVLVTVEREGILDSFVTKVSRRAPIVEVPIKGSYGPNVYVSALVVRGRINEAKPTATFDPGRPAFRLGIAKIDVGWRDYKLNVDVKPAQPIYQVRDQAQVSLSISAPGGALPANAQVALAVVDQGLLELKPNDSWNLLEAMMARRPLEVETAVSQIFVVGKRHFGLKALPFGGGGGRGLTRELFDTLIYWNPKVTLDASGKANITFPLNDSISSFKVAAIVLAGANQFGTGYGEFRTTKDVALFPGIPPVMRNGDLINLEYTAKNGTNVAKDVRIALQVNQALVREQALRLEPGASNSISVPFAIPEEIESLSFEAKAFAMEKEGDSKEVDSIKTTGKVLPRVPVRVFEADLKQVSGKTEFEVAAPKDSIPGRGGAEVTLSSSLNSGLKGVIDYMRAYPFSCLEQRVSKSIAIGDDQLWSDIQGSIPNYLDRSGLAKYFPTDPTGSEVLTGYLLSIAADAGKQLPDNARERMLSGMTEFVNGRIKPQGFDFLSSVSEFRPQVEHLSRRITALGALSRYGRADVAMVSGLWVNLSKLPTPTLVELLGLAQRVKELPERNARIKEVESLLKARLDVRGSVARFTTENDERWWWSMISGDVTALRFALTLMESDESLKRWKPQMPQILRGLFERQREGRWDLSLANAWGRVAIDRQTKLFEAVPVTGKSNVTFGDNAHEFDWSQPSQPFMLPFASGKKLEILHNGTGAPWAMVRTHAAVKLSGELKRGYSIKKEIRPLEVKESGKWHVGDLFEVVLSGKSEAPRTWVALSDPVPPGASILGAGLNRESQMMNSSSSSNSASDAWLAFEERKFEGYVGYFAEMPKGRWSTSYTVRLNASGQFGLPPTRIEAMYAPEMFGELANDEIVVLP